MIGVSWLRVWMGVGLVGLTVLGSCDRSQRATEVYLTRTNGWFAHWFATGAADSVANLFTADGMWRSPHGNDVSGTGPIAERVRDLHQLQATLTYTTESFEQTGTTLTEVGRYRFSFVAPGTQMVLEDWGSYVARWRLEGSSWRLLEHNDVSERPGS